MERRLLTFIVASTAFFLTYFMLRSLVVPPPPPPAAQLEDADPQDDGLEVVDDGDPAVEETAADEADAPDDPDADADTQPSPEPKPQRPEKPTWVTLGSMDAGSNFNLLITLNSKGGAIERLELTERDDRGGFRYRRVDVRHGYLGYFAGTPDTASSGVRVNVVGPGTPAAMAGVEVGDVIVEVAGKPVASRGEITDVLIGTEAGDEIALAVRRSGTTEPIEMTAVLTDHPLDLVRLARDGGTDQVPGNLSRLSCLVGLSQVNRKAILPDERTLSGVPNPADLIWSVEERSVDSGESIGFELNLSESEMSPVGGAVRFRRSYTLRPNSYAVDMDVELQNQDDEPQELAYRLEGPNGITLEGWWYSNKISPKLFSGAAARDVVYYTAADDHQFIGGYELLKRAKNEEDDPALTIFAPDGDDERRTLKYIAVDAQYFTVGYVPATDAQWMNSFRRAAAGVAADPELIPRHQERAVNTTFHLDSVVAPVPPGAKLRHELQLFAGPKRPELLAEYELGEVVYYGWFSTFSRLLAGMLHALSGVGNYALAIVLLTLVVRGAMFPLSRKAAVNAQKMQELAPELKKINEKYKDDMEGKLRAQRELQQRVGFNPLAGCLPMFLQLPIFIGLYRALSVDIELRQEAFSSVTDWASNLAGPDMFYYWGDWLWEYLSGRGTGWLGPYFNVLPVLVVVLFLAQQKLFMPPATDEQTRMTQKMMNVMTLMMGLFFFKVPAGLCIYFITSSLWGICERIIVKKTLPTGKHFDQAVLEGSGATDAKEAKSPSLSQRIREQVKGPTPVVERPNKRKRPGKRKKQ